MLDDTPYGGGAGMVIKPDVVYNAYNSLENKKQSIYMSYTRKVLDQSKVLELAKNEELTILCGHYELQTSSTRWMLTKRYPGAGEIIN